MYAVLPWQWEHSCSAFAEPVTFCRLGAATVSLCVALTATPLSTPVPGPTSVPSGQY